MPKKIIKIISISLTTAICAIFSFKVDAAIFSAGTPTLAPLPTFKIEGRVATLGKNRYPIIELNKLLDTSFPVSAGIPIASSFTQPGATDYNFAAVVTLSLPGDSTCDSLPSYNKNSKEWHYSIHDWDNLNVFRVVTSPCAVTKTATWHDRESCQFKFLTASCTALIAGRVKQTNRSNWYESGKINYVEVHYIVPVQDQSVIKWLLEFSKQNPNYMKLIK